ncbi:MAG: NHL repeat-containing protein, partial [Pseudomonadota bacterium]
SYRSLARVPISFRDLPFDACWGCRGFSLTNNGMLALPDYNRFRAHLYNFENGESISVGGSQGSGDNQMNFPAAAHHLRESRWVVGDSGNQRLLLYDGDRLLKTVNGGNPGNISNLTSPTDLEVDPIKQEVYVLNSSWNRIHVYDFDLNLLRVIQTTDDGKRSDQDTDIWGASDMALDKSGRIYIADTNRNRILVINQNGQYLKEITFAEGSATAFRAPRGVALRSDGSIAVADTGNHRVQILPPIEWGEGH